MKRLTYEKNSGMGVGYWSAAKKDELVQRLGAYEATGLEPEEVAELAAAERAKKEAAEREKKQRDKAQLAAMMYVVKMGR